MFQKLVTLAVCVTLVSFSAYGQNSLRETLVKHNLPITPLVESGLQFAEKQASGPANTANRGGALRLDSIRVFNAYFDKDSVLLSHSHFSYPHPDTTITKKDAYNNGIWIPESKSYTIEKNLYSAQADHKWDATAAEYVPESLAEIFYHSAAKTEYDSIRLFGWNGAAWEEQFSVINEFNADNRIARTYISFMGLAIITINTYDAAGNLTESNEIAELLPGFSVPISKTNYIYQNNRLSEKLEYSIEEPGKPPLPTTKTNYKYDTNGDEIEVKESDWNAKDSIWTLVNAIYRTFDSARRISTETEENLGSDTSRIRHTFAYISGSDYSREETYQWDNLENEWYLGERTYYYYSGSVRTVEPLAQADLKVSPNPVYETLRLEVPANTHIIIRDINGRSLYSGNDATINFAEKPAGTFFVSAFYNSQWHYAKVVKQNN